MKYFSLLFSFVMIISSCSSYKGHQTISIDNKEYEVNRPPNMVKVADNLYADQTEISNLDWLEYNYWLSKVHGEDSNIYENSLPDTTVWSGEISYGEPYLTSYFRHPAYGSYPVVGVNYKQVKDYCLWRTDRVAENILYAKGILEYEEGIYNYLTHEELEEIRKKENIQYPIFRLPTEQEWELIASGGLELTQHPNGIELDKLKKKESLHPFNVKLDEKISDSKYYSYSTTAPVSSYSPNNYKIYNAVGNVAEMVEEQGISKGGSFHHYIDECFIEHQIVYAKPEKWLGFRCVAYYAPEQFKEG